MTRRDFQLIADVLAEVAADYGPRPPIDKVISGMTRALATTNPRFDRSRFERACLRLDRVPVK